MRNKTIRQFSGKATILWRDEPVGPCAFCGAQVGSGPVGVHLEKPTGFVCDSCMIECERGLGLVLMAVNVLRETTQSLKEEERAESVMLHLVLFAKLYERAESEHWPARPIGWGSYLETLHRKYGDALGTLSFEELLSARQQPGSGNGNKQPEED